MPYTVALVGTVDQRSLPAFGLAASRVTQRLSTSFHVFPRFSLPTASPCHL